MGGVKMHFIGYRPSEIYKFELHKLFNAINKVWKDIDEKEKNNIIELLNMYDKFVESVKDRWDEYEQKAIKNLNEIYKYVINLKKEGVKK